MYKINHFSLFCKSCLVEFLTLLMAFRFYAVPPQIFRFKKMKNRHILVLFLEFLKCSEPNLTSCCWLLCITQTGQLWQGTAFF